MFVSVPEQSWSYRFDNFGGEMSHMDSALCYPECEFISISVA